MFWGYNRCISGFEVIEVTDLPYIMFVETKQGRDYGTDYQLPGTLG